MRDPCTEVGRQSREAHRRKRRLHLHKPARLRPISWVDRDRPAARGGLVDVPLHPADEGGEAVRLGARVERGEGTVGAEGGVAVAGPLGAAICCSTDPPRVAGDPSDERIVGRLQERVAEVDAVQVLCVCGEDLDRGSKDEQGNGRGQRRMDEEPSVEPDRGGRRALLVPEACAVQFAPVLTVATIVPPAPTATAVKGVGHETPARSGEEVRSRRRKVMRPRQSGMGELEASEE